MSNFKNRIKDLGLYDSFDTENEFRDLIDLALNDYLVNYTPPVSKKDLRSSNRSFEIPYYLNRNVCSYTDYLDWSYLILDRQRNLKLIDTLSTQNKIVLIGNAGCGKSLELKRLVNQLNNKDIPLYPHIYFLNRYVAQTIEELLPNYYFEIDEDQWLLLLDGFDEIEEKNRNTFIRHMESFCEKFPGAKIILTSRSNLYNSELGKGSGTIKGFATYILTPLTDTEINNYLSIQLNTSKDAFLRSVFTNKLSDLLVNPFYLVHLVDIFKTDKKLPKSRALIFEELIDLALNKDQEKYRTTLSRFETKKILIIKLLQKIALFMEALGKNNISSDYYQRVIPGEEHRDLLEHLSIWKRQSDETWQFDHNNFQEFISAQVLSNQTFLTIQKFLSFEPNHEIIKPSFLNTISFLLSITHLRNSTLYNELTNWIMQISPSILVQFEHDKIAVSTREKIFKEIFIHYKKRKIWIDRDKFSFIELANFGDSNSSINFLLLQIRNSQHYTILSNALSLLRYMKFFSTQTRKQAGKYLLDLILNPNISNQNRGKSLLALSDLKLDSNENVNLIVQKLKRSRNDWIRHGLYYLLLHHDNLDDYINIFLNGIKYIRRSSLPNRDGSRILEEILLLRKGLVKTKSSASIKKIIKHFTKHYTEVDHYIEKEIKEIMINAASAYPEDRSLLKYVVKMFRTFIRGYKYSPANETIIFFDKTNTRSEVFEFFVTEMIQNKNIDSNILAILADVKALDLITDRYEEKHLSDNDVWNVLFGLGQHNKTIYDNFLKLLKNKYGKKFISSIQIDYDRQEKTRLKKDLEVIFDKNLFIKEIDEIYNISKKKILTFQEILQIESEKILDIPLSHNVFKVMRELSNRNDLHHDKLVQTINQWNWDEYCLKNIYVLMINESRSKILDEDKSKILLTEQQKKWIVDWCYSNIRDANFRNSIQLSKKDGQYYVYTKYIYLRYFYIEYDLIYPENIMLDMLSFEWIETTKKVGIQYVEEKLPHHKISSRIIENLTIGIDYDPVLENHLDYCLRNKIYDSLKFAYNEIQNSKRSNYVREISLNIILNLSSHLSEFEKILYKINDEFKWEIIEKLIKHNYKNIRNFLIYKLDHSKEEEKIKTACYLIMLQQEEGLKYYTEWIEINKKLPAIYFRKNPFILNFNKVSSIIVETFLHIQ